MMKRRQKRTNAISRVAARNLHHAFRFTKPMLGEVTLSRYRPANVTNGIALNLVVTINWDMTTSGVDLFDELRNERLCQWLRTRSRQLGRKIEPTYTFAREQNHVHWCIYIPDDLIEEFEDLVPRWITSLELKGSLDRRRSANLPPARDGVVVIGPTKDSVRVRKYMLKGIERRSAAHFGIKVCIGQGEIQGRRVGTSRNLGTAARRSAGYRPQRRPRTYRQLPLPSSIAA